MDDAIRDIIAQELPKLLKENMSVQVDIYDEPYHNEYKNIKVTIEYDGTEIASYSDSIRITECNCNGC